MVVLLIVALGTAAMWLVAEKAARDLRSMFPSEAALQAFADQAREHPAVSHVHAWEDSGQVEIDVALASAGTDHDARDVWCDLVIPMGWADDTLIERGNEYWPPPADCSDPGDVPPARPVDL